MFSKEAFLNRFNEILAEEYGVSPKEANAPQIHDAVSKAVMQNIAEDWKKSKKAHLEARRACYFSMEFLQGRAIFNNLLCLGIEEEVEKALAEVGVNLSDLEEIEDEGDIYESIEEIWPDYPSKEDFLWDEDEY